MTKLAFIAATGIAAAMLSGCVIVDADVRDSGWDRSDYGSLYGAEVSVREAEWYTSESAAVGITWLLVRWVIVTSAASSDAPTCWLNVNVTAGFGRS